VRPACGGHVLRGDCAMSSSNEKSHGRFRFSDDKKEKLVKLFKQGVSVSAIATRLGMSVSSVKRILRDYNIKVTQED
jgi:DNA invertase Pin-like site-specific DNA recombinase